MEQILSSPPHATTLPSVPKAQVITQEDRRGIAFLKKKEGEVNEQKKRDKKREKALLGLYSLCERSK